MPNGLLFAFHMFVFFECLHQKRSHRTSSQWELFQGFHSGCDQEKITKASVVVDPTLGPAVWPTTIIFTPSTSSKASQVRLCSPSENWKNLHNHLTHYKGRISSTSSLETSSLPTCRLSWLTLLPAALLFPVWTLLALLTSLQPARLWNPLYVRAWHSESKRLPGCL